MKASVICMRRRFTYPQTRSVSVSAPRDPYLTGRWTRSVSGTHHRSTPMAGLAWGALTNMAQTGSRPKWRCYPTAYSVVRPNQYLRAPVSNNDRKDA